MTGMTSNFLQQTTTPLPSNLVCRFLIVDEDGWQRGADELRVWGATLLSLWGADDRDRDGESERREGQSRRADHVDKRLSAAIEDGQLEIVDLNQGIVESNAYTCGEQVLGGRNEHAFLHQAGGVADTRDVPADRLDLEPVQIDAPEHDPGTRWCRQNAHGNLRAAVQPDTTALYGSTNCLLVGQETTMGDG